MASYIQTLCVLLIVLTSLRQAQCRKNVMHKISSRTCPKPRFIECSQRLRSKTQYANVKSKKFGANFLCDTKTDRGGWIVIQRRVFKVTHFGQYWEAYKHGFGKVCGDYWLGNENIHKITNSDKYELRIDMVYKSKKYFAHYQQFSIDSENQSYTLHVGAFMGGNVKDDLRSQDNRPFSTQDRNNDHSDGNKQKRCSNGYQAGWWYDGCHHTNLNGQFDHRGYGHGVMWQSLTGSYISLSSVEMKVRKVQRKTKERKKETVKLLVP